MNRLNAAFLKKLNAYGRSRTPCLFIIDFAMKRPLLWPLDELSSDFLQYDFNGKHQLIAEKPLVPFDALQFKRSPMLAADYQVAFQKVQTGLQYGDSFLTNLTFPTGIDMNWSLAESFHQVQARYKLWLKDHFLCFSPEIFIQIEDNQIHSFPMKGTRPALVLGEEDKLMSDAKEQAEHATIVDLIRNDLSQVARQVSVAKYRYLEQIHTPKKSLWQTSSHIQGKLEADWQDRLGDILVKLLPAGSISGAPKAKTIELIQSAEGQNRGYYTGIAGVFDGTSLDSGVLIRFIEEKEEGLRYWSGGGITANSHWQTEYEEMIDKVYLPISHAKNSDREEYLSTPSTFHTDAVTPF